MKQDHFRWTSLILSTTEKTTVLSHAQASKLKNRFFFFSVSALKSRIIHQLTIGQNQHWASIYCLPFIEGEVMVAAGSVMFSSSLWAIPRLSQAEPGQIWVSSVGRKTRPNLTKNAWTEKGYSCTEAKPHQKELCAIICCINERGLHCKFGKEKKQFQKNELTPRPIVFPSLCFVLRVCNNKRSW